MATPQTSQPKTLQDSVKQIAAIAEGVVHISKAMKDLEAGPLKMDTIVILIAHDTKLSQKAIRKVISSLSQLEELYVKPRNKKESI
jgi:hypothetical protein